MNRVSQWTLLSLAILFVGSQGIWEVINGESELEEEDMDLRGEHFIPIQPAASKVNKGHLKIASLEQRHREKKSISSASATSINEHFQRLLPSSVLTSSSSSLSLKLPKSHTGHNQTKSEKIFQNLTSTKTNGVKTASTTVAMSTANNARTNDELDVIVQEGFLILENRGPSRKNRKLAAFMDKSFQDVQGKNGQRGVDYDQLSVDRTRDKAQFTKKQGVEGGAAANESRISLGPGTASGPQSDHNSDKINVSRGAGLESACVDLDSWECWMSKGDVSSLGNTSRLSPRTSVQERRKRQVTKTDLPIESNKTAGSYENLLDCYDCFSGDYATDPDVVIVEPQFTFQATTRIKTNVTILDDNTRNSISNTIKDQLTNIFKDVPGFKNVTIDPDDLWLTWDGTLLVPWTVSIDGGNPIFSGLDGAQVRDIIGGPVLEAGLELVTNVTLGGQHPDSSFNATKASNDVHHQARDPCLMRPSPCPHGYGYCSRLENRGQGIELKCINNCKNYGPCQHSGVCQKDMTGAAYCQCVGDWIGLFCSKHNDTQTPPDLESAPEYHFISQTVFPTKFNISDLTPPLREEIARNMSVQLSDIFSLLPGLRGDLVDPTSVTIDENGRLIVQWSGLLESANFSGHGLEPFDDSVRDTLQNISGIFRNNITISGQHPVADLDYVDITDQIEKGASDPCQTKPCSFGYGHCIANSPQSVTCMHNCNAMIDTCQNNATCQLNSSGDAFCGCPEGWSGKTCSEKTPHQLDGGEITGIVLGSLLVTAGLLGCCFWLAAARRRKREIEFTTYTDLEGLAPFPNVGNKLFVIERPMVSIAPLPVFRPAAMPKLLSAPASMVSSSQQSRSTNVSRTAPLSSIAAAKRMQDQTVYNIKPHISFQE